ncbi:MAG: zinc ribbon-containing protein [Gammaproteobacteria bacterium]|jgi:predicted RNA-binding Zn-ribbon protein involved in translation (DUF1610 family)
MTASPASHGKKLVHAYNRMMERVKDALKHSDKNTLAALQYNIDLAKEKAVELGELSREEAERIGDYLRRDLEDAGEYLADTGSELSSWLHFDVELVEDRLWEAFTAAADQTKLAYLELAQRAQRASEFHTGEVTTVGTLRCSSCGELLHFHGTGHIPPCPKCHSTRFTRPRKRA